MRDPWKVRLAGALLACATIPGGASAQTYQFGNSMFLSTKLRMASFGPMRSVALDCSTSDYFCLRADYLAVAVPRRCATGAPVETKSYAIGEERFRTLGSVRYKGKHVVLVDVLSKPGFAFGYTPDGVQFVMIAPLIKGRMLELSEAPAGAKLQNAFERAKPYLLARSGDEKMFDCERHG